MTQPRLWLDEIKDALRELGGKGHLQDIYRKIQQRNRMNLDYATWENTIRRTIEQHSSDSDAFEGRSDDFYSVEGIGKGVWGLRDD